MELLVIIILLMIDFMVLLLEIEMNNCLVVIKKLDLHIKKHMIDGVDIILQLVFQMDFLQQVNEITNLYILLIKNLF